MGSVEIFTKASCSFCLKAKALLAQLNVPYTEHVIGTQHTKESIQQKLTEMSITTQVRTVPQIFYTSDKTGKTTYIGGFTELQANQAILGT